jgi:hypothetical protein
MTVNLKVTAGHPGSRAEASRHFRGRRHGIAHGGVGADSPHKMYPVHQSYTHQLAKSPCIYYPKEKR